jgi:N-acetylmuramoyl-L-alanine amidase/putative methionine-R-sulfoxide reductase with GAF domain
MATHPSNANPGLTIKPMGTPEAAPQGNVATAKPQADEREVLQALLAFSTLHEQIRRKRTEDAKRYAAGLGPGRDAWEFEKFVLDEVLQLVAERAQAVTGAHGIAIAIAEGDEIICRASVGNMVPDRGVRLDSKAGFSGACFRTGRIIRCDDSERDPRVNVEACRRLGTRSMVAVPLQSQGSVLGLLEAFSTQPFGFNDGDVRSLNLLAELILAALKPEDEEKMARAAKVAAAELRTAELDSLRQIPMTPPPPASIAPPPSFPSGYAPAEPEAIPLELAKESIAPALHDDGGEALHRVAVMGLTALLLVGILTTGLVWWRLHNASHGADAADSKHAPAAAIQPVGAPQSNTPPDVAALTTAANDATRYTTSAKPAGTALVTGIEHYSSAGLSTVVVMLQDRVRYEKHSLSDPDRIYFDLMDTSLAPGLNGKVIDVQDGLIGRVRIAKPSDNVTRVVLDAKSGSSCSESLEQTPYRLVIEVRGPGAPPKPNVDQTSVPAQSTSPSTPPSPAPAKEDPQTGAHAGKLRIVLDPGHGGWDLGTIGREGLMEKNLVLEVAQRLGTLLQGRLGADVIYTRNDDDYVSLEQRAELANKDQADLFVSVHANYSTLATARGVETYYSSFFSPPEAREIEFRENGNALAVTHAKLTGVQLRDKVEASRKLATDVQRALHGTLASQGTGIRNRGVREASFVVLTGTEMPSILAEISFVSSPTDEEKLRNAEYRQQIAEALFKGIEHFASTTRHVKIASTTPRTQGQ